MVDERRQLKDRSWELNFFGRLIDDRYLDAAIERNGVSSPVNVSPVWCHLTSYYHDRRGLKIAKSVHTIDANRFSTAKTLYEEITDHLYDAIKAMHYHRVNTGMSTIFSLQLIQNLVSHYDGNIEAIMRDMALLLSNSSNVESADVPTSLQNLADDIIRSANKETFINLDVKAATRMLQEDNGNLGHSFRSFLRRHAHRSFKEFDLSTRPWGENPEKLVMSLQSYLIRNVNLIRKPLRRLGLLLQEEGKLPDPELVLFLTYDEITQLVHAHVPYIVNKVRHRQRLFKKMDKLNFPEINSGIPRPQGDILITYSTDVGWTPYFPLLSGVVTELGGLMSHELRDTNMFVLSSLLAFLSAVWRNFLTRDILRNKDHGNFGKFLATIGAVKEPGCFCGGEIQDARHLLLECPIFRDFRENRFGRIGQLDEFVDKKEKNVGATRVTSARVDRRILRQAVAAPQATCTAILKHVQDTLDHSISTRTISRRLVANGLHSCRPLRRLPLTPPNRRQRLEWCRARSTWMTEWHRVVFSDESRFCLSSDSRRVRVWRRRGERSNPAAIVERPTVRQRGIMVWGAIAYDSRLPLLRIQGTMTAQRYVDDVLRPVTLPYLQGVPNALYQQDNARPHTARISQQALQDVQMLPWPPYSPDLSPIEHVWDIIGRRLHALPQPRSEDELWQMVEREWRAIPQDAIRTLSDSLPRRVAACIAVRGGPTCY
ncbi:hypothetical protein LAZ67_3001700 [Cordylochernes scorpioides]|uniref:Transposase n=1 Tax=Cordylochernes scorpioides TaxID=51811 RepID=A0ABY6K7B3_9ARAC|nr:hypothetical protein LAZ67_3001700 [Cordylochernes scorpioides]